MQRSKSKQRENNTHGVRIREGHSMETILEILRGQTGVDYSTYRREPMMRRIERTMSDKNIRLVTDYIDLLRNSPLEAKKLGREFLVAELSRSRDRRKRDEGLNRLVVNKYAPPTIFCDSEFKLVHSFGQVNNFLKLPKQGINMDVREMTSGEVPLVISTAINKVMEHGHSIRTEPVYCPGNPYGDEVVLSIEPVEQKIDREVFMISFERPLPDHADVETLRLSEESRDLIARLQEETRMSSEYYQSFLEDLAANLRNVENRNRDLKTVNRRLNDMGKELNDKIADLHVVNEELLNLIQTTTIGSLILDDSLRIIRFTTATRREFNIRKRDIGRPVTDISFNLQYEQLANDARRVLQENAPIEREIKSVTGNWYLLRMQPLIKQSLQPEGVIITFVDFSDHKAVSERNASLAQRLEKRNTQLNAVFTAIPDFLCVTDNAGIIQEFISGLEHNMPSDSSDFEGKSITSIVPKRVTAKVERTVKLVGSSRTAKTIEYSTGSGKKRGYFEMRLIPLGNDDVMAITRDITALKLTQRELSRRVSELDEANSRLEAYIESNLELENFAHIASHDLKEPTRNISMFAQLLERNCAEVKVSDASAQEYLDHIKRSANQMHTLVEGLLNYAKVGSQENELAEFPLRKSILTASENLKVQLAENDADLEIGKLPKVKSDMLKMTQVFQNLISNAVKFRNPNKACKIQVSSHKRNGQYMIRVKDNGIGIAPEFHDKVFLTFKQLHNKSQYGGAGIGLALCKKVVESLGGRIWVESALMQGACFCLTIPIEE